MNKINKFQRTIYQYYHDHQRKMPWRETRDPYHILVSEVMLQQTQVSRVLDKYRQFITVFPTLQDLAKASLKEVLTIWQGLGYNRRALALCKLAKIVVSQYGGKIPSDQELLQSLPGIGEATAGALCAFAFDQPVVFIETNIRSVFIQCFFKGKTSISDRQLLPLIAKTLDENDPRNWYYALMDYGVFLKEQQPNPGRKSRHYQKQSRFAGSNRQHRGAILKLLLRYEQLEVNKISVLIKAEPAKTKIILNTLCREGLVREKNGKYAV
ncbi:MAG: A/G-specific adenine glycosylase [bacterium]|nr:A/G-specific adenine glycosylase [bacterium]